MYRAFRQRDTAYSGRQRKYGVTSTPYEEMLLMMGGSKRFSFWCVRTMTPQAYSCLPELNRVLAAG